MTLGNSTSTRPVSFTSLEAELKGRLFLPQNRLSKRGSPKGRISGYPTKSLILWGKIPFRINSSPSPFQGEGDKEGEVFRQHQKSSSLLPGAVLCHGMGTDSRAIKAPAMDLAKQGVAALIFDFRGHGKSGGICDGDTAADVVAAARYLISQPGIDRQRLALVGHSLGAMGAALAVQGLEEVSALVLLSPPGETTTEVVWREPSEKKKGKTEFDYPRAGLLPWLDPFTARTAWSWMKLRNYRFHVDWRKYFEAREWDKFPTALEQRKPCPLLWVCCTGDKRVPYEASIRLYDRAKPPKKLLLHQGGAHSTPLMPGKLRKEWIAWLVSQLIRGGGLSQRTET